MYKRQAYARSGMQLVREAKEAFETLSEDAKKEGMNIIAMSSYRLSLIHILKFQLNINLLLRFYTS